MTYLEILAALAMNRGIYQEFNRDIFRHILHREAEGFIKEEKIPVGQAKISD